MSFDNIRYADLTIYLILSHLPEQNNYHVGIYVALNGETGLIYHATGRSCDFVYDGHMSENIQHSKEIRLALIIGRISQEAQLDLIDDRIMPNVPVHNEDPAFDCWTWVRQALLELRTAGILQFSCTPEDIEAEARTFVRGVESQGQVGNDRVKESRLCR